MPGWRGGVHPNGGGHLDGELLGDPGATRPSDATERGYKALSFAGASPQHADGHFPSEPFWMEEQNGGVCLAQKGRVHFHAAVRLPTKQNALLPSNYATGWGQLNVNVLN